ncbi:hypothetical protein NMG60_11015581 [Bertholletia excelsa]
MDLETENRIAAILMKEAAELRRQSEEEGVHAYLRKPHVRGRPNSRFLTATVLGVQQANRSVEVNEMWRVRQKELELDDRIKGRLGDDSDASDSRRTMSKRRAHSETSASATCSSRREIQDGYSREEGFRDEELEEFLHSRVKRGRGEVGSRMDETGPYLPFDSDTKEKQLGGHNEWNREGWEHCAIVGPKKPSSLNSCESSEEESLHDRQKKKGKKNGSSKRHSRKHGSKEKSKDKKKKKKTRKEEKRHKHRK